MGKTSSPRLVFIISARPLILYFHGNAETVDDYIRPEVSSFVCWQLHVLCIHGRGSVITTTSGGRIFWTGWIQKDSFGREVSNYQGPLDGGFSNGGGFGSPPLVPDLDASAPICCFYDFLDFPFSLGDFPDSSGDFLIYLSFPLCRFFLSTYKEHSRKGPRHNQGLSRRKWETPRFGNLPVYH